MDNPLIDVILSTVRVLDTERIPYAVTGSVASSIHGEPCVSADVDTVVRMTPEQATRLARLLPSRFYRSEQALVEAATQSSIANLVDTQTGLKVDLFVLSPGQFHDRVLERAGPAPTAAGEASFRCVSPEDIILMKLAGAGSRVRKSSGRMRSASCVCRARGWIGSICSSRRSRSGSQMI